MANDTKLFEAEQNNLTERLKADMASDSWLSKNIRPATLAYILTAYLALAVLDGLGFRVAESYVTLLGQWGMLVMSFYFGGRTLEKIMDMKKGSKLTSPLSTSQRHAAPRWRTQPSTPRPSTRHAIALTSTPNSGCRHSWQPWPLSQLI